MSIVLQCESDCSVPSTTNSPTKQQQHLTLLELLAMFGGCVALFVGAAFLLSATQTAFEETTVVEHVLYARHGVCATDLQRAFALRLVFVMLLAIAGMVFVAQRAWCQFIEPTVSKLPGYTILCTILSVIGVAIGVVLYWSLTYAIAAIGFMFSEKISTKKKAAVSRLLHFSLLGVTIRPHIFCYDSFAKRSDIHTYIHTYIGQSFVFRRGQVNKSAMFVSRAR
jgi:hypothetical protein